MPTLKGAANIAEAGSAVRYVESKLDIGASNKVGPGMITRMLCAGGTFNKGELREQVDQDLAKIKKPTWRDVLDRSAEWTRHYGCGNCGEQSALAFVYLRERRLFPLDWMHIDSFKHAFVVLGRLSGSDETNYTTWGPDSAVCDPWVGRADSSMKLPLWYPRTLWYPRAKLVLLHREEG